MIFSHCNDFLSSMPSVVKAAYSLWKAELERERGLFYSSGLLLKQLQQPGMGQTVAKNQQLYYVSHVDIGAQGLAAATAAAQVCQGAWLEVEQPGLKPVPM